MSARIEQNGPFCHSRQTDCACEQDVSCLFDELDGCGERESKLRERLLLGILSSNFTHSLYRQSLTVCKPTTPHSQEPQTIHDHASVTSPLEQNELYCHSRQTGCACEQDGSYVSDELEGERGVECGERLLLDLLHPWIFERPIILRHFVNLVNQTPTNRPTNRRIHSHHRTRNANSTAPSANPTTSFFLSLPIPHHPLAPTLTSPNHPSPEL